MGLCFCMALSAVHGVFASEAETVSLPEEVWTEPAIEETAAVQEETAGAEPTEVLPAPEQVYRELMAAQTLEQMEKLRQGLGDGGVQALVSALTQEQIAQVNAKAEGLMPEETAPPEPEPQEPERPEVYPAKNVTHAAPFLPPVPGADERSGEGEPEQDQGICTNKSVSEPDEKGHRTLTLEAWVTGSKTIIDQEIQIPADIVLVLDQSGSMQDDFTSVRYEPFRGQPKQLYQRRRQLYVKRGDGSFAPVTVERQSSPQGTYVPFFQQTNRDYFSASGSFFHKCADGSYGAVRVEHSFFVGYTYRCAACGTLGSSQGVTSVPECSGGFYKPRLQTEYRFSYRETDGTAVTVTVGEGAAAPDWDFHLSKPAGSTSRLKALQKAVTAFTDGVAEKAKGPDGISGTEDDVNHRIAVVGFASSDFRASYENTEIFIGAEQHRYDRVTDGLCAKALQNMDQAQGRANVASSIGALSAEGATYINCGVELGNRILQNNPVEPGAKRSRIMIVFTDGQPGYSDYDANVARSAINASAVTKQMGATVYSVGIFDGADASSPGAEHGSPIQRSNWFMQHLSSNNGTVRDPSYYLSAGDADALERIFQTISDNIESGGSSIQLGKETVMQDVIADAFVLPEGTDAQDIKAYTADYLGENRFGDRVPFTPAVTVSPDRRTVTVTNFDYSENWVGKVTDNGQVSYRGKKLIVEIPIAVREGFLGGNDVYTNGIDSGIFSGGEQIRPFQRPSVCVPIPEITVSVPEKNVYLMGGLNQQQLMQGVTVTAGGVDLLGPLEPWQTEYVNLTILRPEPMDSLTDDGGYAVSAELTSGSGPQAQVQTGSASAAVNVFCPRLTFCDSTVYYGDREPEGYAGNLTDICWLHGDISDEQVQMTGAEPELELSFRPGDGLQDGIVCTKSDIPVAVTPAIGGRPVEQWTEFAHGDCSGGCGFDPAQGAFFLHVKTCRLHVGKQGGRAAEPYVLTVLRNGSPYTQLTVMAGQSDTVYELPVGTYTLQEDTDWAWRYQSVQVSEGVSLTPEQPEGTVTCTNRDRLRQWLNGFSAVVQNIMGVQEEGRHEP